MTREEAIRCLSVHSSTNGSGLCTDEQHYKAKQMAIKALKREERWEKHICFDCKYFSENEEEYDEERCLKCTLIGTEWEQKK